MAKRVRITNNLGGVFTPLLNSRAVAELLLALHGGGHTTSQTARAMADHDTLRRGGTVTHARGYTLEPIDLEPEAEESSDDQ